MQDNQITEYENTIACLRAELAQTQARLLEMKRETQEVMDIFIQSQQDLVRERCKRRAAEILSGAPTVWQPQNHHLVEE